MWTNSVGVLKGLATTYLPPENLRVGGSNPLQGIVFLAILESLNGALHRVRRATHKELQIE